MQQHCYFHRSHFIQHFCALKQCTLPLCQQCLEIHEQQHRQKQQFSSIIPYQQAYQQVFGNLSVFIQNNKNPLQSLINQIKKDKNQVLQTIEKYFKQLEVKIQQESKYLAQIQQKLQKLKKGSIKTVIYYFSGQIALKEPQLPQFKPIASLLQKIIKNIPLENKEQIQTFRQQKGAQLQWSESKIQPYEPKHQSHSKKKSIFQNQKSKISNHKNNNQPYIENIRIIKDEVAPKYSYENYQQQKIVTQQDKSQVDNYFQNYKIDSVKQQTNTYRGELKSFKIESKNIRNYQIESQLGVQISGNSNILKERPAQLNHQLRELRSKTLGKFPSMMDLNLKKGRQNISVLHNEQDYSKRAQEITQKYQPGKWNKQRQEQEKQKKLERQPSMFSQINIQEPMKPSCPSASQFSNRQPLKTTDLETYIPSNNIQTSIQARERSASHELGIRTTTSHNNLHTGKRIEPLLQDEFKKQVLSPHQIRKMLEKKIQERNKVLTQKKEHQLKIHTDKVTPNLALGLATKAPSHQTYNQRPQEEQDGGRYDKNRKTIGNWMPSEPKSSLYNTKDSIINQIYRQTRY